MLGRLAGHPDQKGKRTVYSFNTGTRTEHRAQKSPIEMC